VDPAKEIGGTLDAIRGGLGSRDRASGPVHNTGIVFRQT
jgi:hypothetical protein